MSWEDFSSEISVRFRVAGVYAVMRPALDDMDDVERAGLTTEARLLTTTKFTLLDLNDDSLETDDFIMALHILKIAVLVFYGKWSPLCHPTTCGYSCGSNVLGRC